MLAGRTANLHGEQIHSAHRLPFLDAKPHRATSPDSMAGTWF